VYLHAYGGRRDGVGVSSIIAMKACANVKTTLEQFLANAGLYILPFWFEILKVYLVFERDIED